MEIEGEVKRISKLSGLIPKDNVVENGMSINVYFSKNEWETCEEINLVTDENITVLQLIDSAVYKFKEDFFIDDIDSKRFNLMLFKKKVRKPNYDYPICNPDSLIKDYHKAHFCLVEEVEQKKKNEDKTKNLTIENNINISENKKVEQSKNSDISSCSNCMICEIF